MKPSSTSIGTSVMVASLEKWKVVLEMSDMEKYFSLKWRSSTIGALANRHSTNTNASSRTRNKPCIGRW